jgi:mannobiose 2-epimerase
MHNSVGHDIEAACFLSDAAVVLGRGDDAKTRDTARAMVDHALAWGWDRVNGGFWFAGQAFGPPFDRSKSWWVQAEGIHALAYMHERYADETDVYWRALLLQIDFVLRFQADHRNGGWHATVSEDGRTVISDVKADAWKAGYHDGRAIMDTVTRLRRLATRGL